MALESAHTLGCLFSAIEDPSQIPRFLGAFNEIREPRIEFAQETDRHYLTFSMMPLGEDEPETLLEDDSEEAILSIFGPEIEMYAYDSGVETTSWWNQYGSMVIDSHAHKPKAFDFQIQVGVAMTA